MKVVHAVLFSILASCTGIAADETEKQPNIILFLVDDMGWQDTSVPFWTEESAFNRRYHTPEMERMAAEGMLFTQAYAASVCSPTRVSLMSGMNAARHGVTNWTLRRNASVDAPHDILGFPDWNVNGLQPVDSIERSVQASLLPQILQDNGYFTIHCGKAHFGAMETPAANPENCGFDVNIAGHAAGGPGSFLGTENFGNSEKGGHTLPWGVPGLESYHGDSLFLTEALTREARKAMDKALAANKPFYLYMSHYAVHVPLHADPRFYQKYIDGGLPESEARYASMLEGMDKSLGDLMDYLEENGLTENTIVLFMSDNGGLSVSARAGQPHTHNRPLNSGKGSAYEGGIRVPMMVKWPEKVKPASKNDALVIIEDFFPTLLEMAGITNYETVQTVDGESFVPLLANPETKPSSRRLFWHFPNNWGPTGPGIGASSTIRSGDWKLIYYYEDQQAELFNIPGDIGEQHNLIQKYPQKATEMAKQLGSYLRSVNAQRPFLKATGKPVPWPDEVLF
ncbi:Arylsulfatase A [Cyclobacterium xiamenense]|uniref:Arylsulfatase A n=2 Tax=Cyclobacterium xiamenense TaxID=1297121 RepID=A0A1H7BJ22_9BACT|nr:Arylsulfatase A [Cyclobacterium xiamenense]